MAAALADALKGSTDPTAKVLADSLARAGYGTPPTTGSAPASTAPVVPSSAPVKPAAVAPAGAEPASTHLSSYTGPAAAQSPCGVQITILPIDGAAGGGN